MDSFAIQPQGRLELLKLEVTSRLRRRGMCAILLCSAALSTAAANDTKGPPDVEIWRLDCGEFKDFDIRDMSDVFSYPSKKKTLSDGCYLIRHGKQFMLWDTGFSAASLSKYKAMGIEMKQPLPAQLKKINVSPEQVSIVGLSHMHLDHTGQAASFRKARLLMGKADLEYMADKREGSTTDDISPWLRAGAPNVKQVVGDEDVLAMGV